MALEGTHSADNYIYAADDLCSANLYIVIISVHL